MLARWPEDPNGQGPSQHPGRGTGLPGSFLRHHAPHLPSREQRSPHAPPSGHRAVAQAPQSPSRSPLPPRCWEEGPSFGDSCGFSAVSGDSALIPGSRQHDQAPAVSRGKSPSPLRSWLACCQTAPKLLACPHPPTVFWSLLVRGWAGSRAESSGRPRPWPLHSLHCPCCRGHCAYVPWNGPGTAARGCPVWR